MNEWIDHRWKHDHGWMDALMNEWMDALMNEWMD